MVDDGSNSQDEETTPPVLDYRPGGADVVEIPKSSTDGITAVISSLILGSVIAAVFAIGQSAFGRVWDGSILLLLPVAVFFGAAAVRLFTQATRRDRHLSQPGNSNPQHRSSDE